MDRGHRVHRRRQPEQRDRVRRRRRLLILTRTRGTVCSLRRRDCSLRRAATEVPATWASVERASLAGMARAAFMRLLGEHGGPVIDYSVEELERELRVLGVE